MKRGLYGFFCRFLRNIDFSPICGWEMVNRCLDSKLQGIKKAPGISGCNGDKMLQCAIFKPDIILAVSALLVLKRIISNPEKILFFQLLQLEYP